MVKSYKFVLKFVNNLKIRLKSKFPDKYAHFELLNNVNDAALKLLLKIEQRDQFSEVFHYFQNTVMPKKNIPNLVLQLNLFEDTTGLIRVGSKMMGHRNSYFPILLPKSSFVTNLIILDAHQKTSHSGIYAVLAELRREFWVPCCFSAVKKVLRDCFHCKRYNAQPIKINQGMYREFRLEPGTVPFANVFIDYAGPYTVYVNSKASKVYVLVVTCLFTRAISLRVSLDLSVGEFIRSFQLHAFDQGVPQKVLSDLGSQIVAGSERIMSLVADPDTQSYFEERGVKSISFEQFYKGRKELGSLVECCVKMTKRLLSGAIRNNVLPLRQFEYFVAQSAHLANRRPIAFKDSLRDNVSSVLPEPITPEILLHGRELISTNLVPSLQSVEEADPDYESGDQQIQSIRLAHDKLRRVRDRLFQVYNDEFIPQLIRQAVDQKLRYKPVSHKKLQVGDVVLIKEELTKRTNLPMGKVLEVQINDLGETTGAVLWKGSTREKVKRHSSTLIPILSSCDEAFTPGEYVPNSLETQQASESIPGRRQKRGAAVRSEHLSRAMLSE